MATTYVSYKKPIITTERKYDVEGVAPDVPVAEAGGNRTITIRPRSLELRTTSRPGEKHDLTIVTSVTIEGRQVRKSDGGLGQSRVWTWSAKGWRGYEEPPGWIMEIIKAEDLWYGA